MARVKNLQTNFTSGELDPKLRGRRTIKHWFNGAKYLRNVLLRPQGGVHRRDGGLFRDRLINKVTKVQNDVVDGTKEDLSSALIDNSTFDNEDRIIDDSTVLAAISSSATSANVTIDNIGQLTLTGVKLVEPDSTHILGSGSDRNVTVTVEGSNTGAFGGEETTLGTKVISALAGSATPFNPQTYEMGMTDTATAFRWFKFSFSWTTAAAFFLGEIEMYSGGEPFPMTAAAPNGGTADNVIDDDSSTEVLTTTNLSTTDEYVVAQITLATGRPIVFVDVKGLKLSAAPTGAEAIVDAFQVQHSNSAGIFWTDFGPPISSVTTTNVSRRRSADDGQATIANRLNWRLVRIGTQDAGTAKVHLDDLILWEESSEPSEVKMLPFMKTLDTRYMCVHTDQNVRVFKNGVRQVDIASPITGAQLLEIDYVQRLDTLILFHETLQPHKIFRESGDIEWSSAPQAFTNIPQFDFGDGDEDTWSDAKGWPRCGTFFQGRLWMAGSTERPDGIWASKSDDLFNFDVGTGLDDEAIDKTILSDTLVSFRQLYAGRHLYAFGETAEFYAESSEDTIQVPDTFDLRRTTKSGIKPGTEPWEVDGAVLFVQRGGNVIREFIFTDTEAAYQASNVSLLSAHLIRTPIDMALRKAVDEDDADILFCVNADGSLATFTTLRTQEINAWMMQHTEGGFSSTGGYKAFGVDLDDVYCVVRRFVDFDGDLIAEPNNYFEQWVPGALTDAGVQGTFADAVGIPGDQTIGGMLHLAGKTVEVILDKVNRGTFTVNNLGQVDVPDFTETYEAGLPFPDVTDDVDIAGDTDNDKPGDDTVELTDKQVLIVELPVEGNLPDGTIAAKKKRITDIGMLFHETRHAELNGDPMTFRQFGGSVLGSPVPKFTGMYREGGLLGWDLDGAASISQSRAAEFELLAIVKEVSA